ncbi:MAG: hypothetical protein JRG76_15320 [Deltaproteobacteria bacterium]|nr:hypothetical protein [Deltaproteobacteria bacterium]
MWEAVGSWRVAFAAGAPRDEISRLLESLGRGDLPASATEIKSGRLRQVLRVPVDSGAVFVKRYPGAGVLDRFVPWPRRSRAYQEHVNLERVRALGLRAAEPVCTAEKRRGPWLDESLLVTRDVAALATLGTTLHDAGSETRDALLSDLGRVARRLHDAGLWHRDMHRGNFLVSGTGAEACSTMIDLQKLRALRVSLPSTLRVLDLAMASGTDSVQAATLMAGYGDDRLADRVLRASRQRRRRRLRSRGRRCVVPSTGFRIEDSGALRVYRRADIEMAAVLEALENGRASGRVDGVRGGPLAGPVVDTHARGHGASEAGAPAEGPVAVTELAGSRCPWPARSAGMRAWRGAHAALLRGFDTPAPLSLVEERHLGWTRRSWLLTRWEPTEPMLQPGEAESARESARDAARTLARLHASGLHYRDLDPDQLRVRPETGGRVVLTGLERLRVGTRVRADSRVSDLANLAHGVERGASGVPRAELARRLAPYRDGGEAADAAWRIVFAGVEPE